ncbi:hypothetical protein CQA53_09995 [Helicobacter didelphidarum]|uniref:Uncharacterized protein n=1 Tax=Helicobacter didelphidarum TaxID=2040648 RepID=A0A3D8I938_9HELI|nr:hypothetical protein [Helicobacter didelphidarum]RDU61535.1 hypothetical protein CQA53_09995 [Helicobacter didelphidarum]
MGNKDFIGHVKDFGNGIYDTFIVAPYQFGDFLGRISGLRDWQHGSVVMKDYYQQEAINELKMLRMGIKSIDSLDKAKNLFQLIKEDVKDRPWYYLGSLLTTQGVASTINTGRKILDKGLQNTYKSSIFLGKATDKAHQIYPYYHTLKNLCSFYDTNSSLSILSKDTDMIVCKILKNDDTTSQPDSKQPNTTNEPIQNSPKDKKSNIKLNFNQQQFNINLKQIKDKYDAHEVISVASLDNPNVAFIQKINIKDIETITKDSPIYLLKALYFCEDYILLDSNKEPLLKESNWREFYNYKSDFYILFIADKQTLTQDYINERIILYKSIMQIRKQTQDKELQELQKQQQELEQQLQGLDSKQRESKLQEIQKEHAKKQREKERQEQQEARFSKSNTQNLNTTNNNVSITKDSYLVLESNDKDTKIIFLDSLKDPQSHIRSFTNFQDSNNSYLANTSLSFTHLILQCNNKVTIFTRDNSIIDSKQLEIDFKIDLNNTPCDVYLYSLLLRGGEEDMDNPRFFYGKKGEVYISDESDNIEVCYHNATMKMTNYYYHAYS